MDDKKPYDYPNQSANVKTRKRRTDEERWTKMKIENYKEALQREWTRIKDDRVKRKEEMNTVREYEKNKKDRIRAESLHARMMKLGQKYENISGKLEDGSDFVQSMSVQSNASLNLFQASTTASVPKYEQTYVPSNVVQSSLKDQSSSKMVDNTGFKLSKVSSNIEGNKVTVQQPEQEFQSDYKRWLQWKNYSLDMEWDYLTENPELLATQMAMVSEWEKAKADLEEAQAKKRKLDQELNEKKEMFKRKFQMPAAFYSERLPPMNNIQHAPSSSVSRPQSNVLLNVQSSSVPSVIMNPVNRSLPSYPLTNGMRPPETPFPPSRMPQTTIQVVPRFNDSRETPMRRPQ